ncbi:helix-turn-helix domain-containing protein [Nonomuraea sp. SYSU D8015]|uniref:helix-turn-helix domain-containing protein n=1 Tax=Nonomuraea sp. SYSU D8015 TaxID=2593644 RepID=UPI001CB703B2|nr:helix-turn-helix transcriptional regulator [Nonomuraea sp. SYSU D8015]
MGVTQFTQAWRGGKPTTDFKKWSDVRDGHIERAGGEKALAETRGMIEAYVRAWHLAERRKNAGLTQSEVAEKMGVTKMRVSQIENGDVTSVEVLARSVEAIGGRVGLTATFDDGRYRMGDATAAM